MLPDMEVICMLIFNPQATMSGRTSPSGLASRQNLPV